jgi:hypothetical protein
MLGNARLYPDTSTPETRASYRAAVRRHLALLAETTIPGERAKLLRLIDAIDNRQEEPMPEYYLEWRIEIEAESPEEAARKALKIQRDPESIATMFHVIADNGEDTVIDLTEIDADRALDAEEGEASTMPTFTVTRYQTVSVSQDIDIEADTAEEARTLAQAAEESEWSTGDIGEPTGEDPDFEVRDEDGELLIAIAGRVDDNPFDPESPEGRAWSDGDRSAVEA